MQEYEKTNYGTAKKLFEQLKKYEYKDSNDKYNSCINIIEQEKSQYYGVWIENQRFWDNLKIDENSFLHRASQRDLLLDDWSSYTRMEYDEDKAIYTFPYMGKHYETRINGDRLTLICIDLKNQYDTDWFGTHNKFYRQK